MSQTVEVLRRTSQRGRWFWASCVLVGLCAGVRAQPVLEEVVVTATKRSESVQSLPQSVSSISGEDLRERGLTEFFDYAVTKVRPRSSRRLLKTAPAFLIGALALSPITCQTRQRSPVRRRR